MRKLSVQEVLDRIQSKYPYITQINQDEYENTHSYCSFYDSRPNAGWFRTKPVDIFTGHTSGHRNYRLRKILTISEVFSKIQIKVPHITQMVESEYKNANTACSFFDNRPGAGWFKTAPINLMDGSVQGHPSLNKRKKRTSDETLMDLQVKYPYLTQIDGFVNTKVSCSFFDDRPGKGWFKCRPNDLFTGRQTGFPDIERGISDQEIEFYEWIKSICPDALHRYKHESLGRAELDIFIPSLSVGLEYNGAYWHSVKYRSSKYHKNRTDFAASIGIKLIHIWDYEWIHKKEQLQSFLLSALGKNEIRIMARKCKIVEITKNEAFEFCNKYHIQGAPNHASAKHFIGCKYGDELVGLSVFGQHHRQNGPKIHLLVRMVYKTGVTVSGGLSRMMKYIYDKLQQPIGTYVDLAKSTGKSYLQSGWHLERIGKPDYFYVDGRKDTYVSKQSMKKGPDGVAESEKVKKLKYNKVYDCGKSFLVYDPNK